MSLLAIIAGAAAAAPKLSSANGSAGFDRNPLPLAGAALAPNSYSASNLAKSLLLLLLLPLPLLGAGVSVDEDDDTDDEDSVARLALALATFTEPPAAALLLVRLLLLALLANSSSNPLPPKKSLLKSVANAPLLIVAADADVDGAVVDDRRGTPNGSQLLRPVLLMLPMLPPNALSSMLVPLVLVAVCRLEMLAEWSFRLKLSWNVSKKGSAEVRATGAAVVSN